MKLVEKTWTALEKEEMVLKEYDFYPQKVEKHGRVKKVVCSRGKFALKKTSASQSQMKFILDCFRKLEVNSFPHVLRFYPTKYGDPYVQIDDECYYVTEWIEDVIEEKYKDEWEKEILVSIGQMHAATRLAGEQPRNTALSIRALLKRWQKRILQMGEYRSLAQDRSVISPVEATFLTHFDYLHELAQKAMRYLQQWEERYQTKTTLPLVLCHGSIHRKHVLHSKETHYFIDFDQAKLDTPARELALFFRRHADKVFECDSLAIAWLGEYEKYFPLEKRDRILLAIYLLFPERVFKEVENYYEAVRGWSALKHARYLEKQIRDTSQIRKFVRDILG